MDPEKAAMANPGEKTPIAQPPMGQSSMAQPYMGQPPMAQPPMGQMSAPPPYNLQQGPPGPGQAFPQINGYQSYGGGYGVQPYPPGQQYAAQLGPYTIQPGVYVTQPPLAVPVNDYMSYSIFTMMCCFLPVGIAALIHSISARDANLRGDQAEAERSSKTAKNLNHIALGIGISIIVIAIIWVAVAFSVVYSSWDDMN